MFYFSNDFPWIKTFEDNWEAIRSEMLELKSSFVQWHEKELNPKENWTVYPIYDWPTSKPVLPYANYVPKTRLIIDKIFPKDKVGAVGFSRLAPHSNIPPHKNYIHKFLRFHLGLDVPDGDVSINVGGHKYNWRNGEGVVFCDHLDHSVVNNTNESRVILLVDFIPDQPIEQYRSSV